MRKLFRYDCWPTCGRGVETQRFRTQGPYRTRHYSPTVHRSPMRRAWTYPLKPLSRRCARASGSRNTQLCRMAMDNATQDIYRRHPRPAHFPADGEGNPGFVSWHSEEQPLLDIKAGDGDRPSARNAILTAYLVDNIDFISISSPGSEHQAKSDDGYFRPHGSSKSHLPTPGMGRVILDADFWKRARELPRPRALNLRSFALSGPSRWDAFKRDDLLCDLSAAAPARPSFSVCNAYNNFNSAAASDPLPQNTPARGQPQIRHHD